MKYLKKGKKNIAYAKVGIYGDAGSGKSRTATEIAIGLHKAIKSKKPIAVFDTEPAFHFLLPLFEKNKIDAFVYDESRALVDLLGFIKEAEKECDIVIVDSITLVWLELQESYLDKINADRKRYGKFEKKALEFQDWRYIKKAWQTFTDLYLSSKLHFIVCGRTSSVYEFQDGENGRKELITVGTKMATEKGMGYEPSLLIEMLRDFDKNTNRIINRAVVEKDRADTLNGNVIDFPTYKSFEPHFKFINIGGEHFGFKTSNSQELFNEDGEDRWSAEKRERAIIAEEIQGLFIQYYPKTDADSKKLKMLIMFEIFGTRSWAKIENMNSGILKSKIEPLIKLLEDLKSGNKKFEDLKESIENVSE